MPTGKTHEFKGTVYTEIPKEIVSSLKLTVGNDINFEVNQGKVIISVSASKQSNTYDAILKKLSAIKHIERTEEKVKQISNAGEQKQIEELIDKKILFRYSKDGKNFIGIKKEYVTGPEHPKQEQITKDLTTDPVIAQLETEGFMILEGGQIPEFVARLQQNNKTGTVIGIRGFDKKFYVITAQTFTRFSNTLLNAVEKPAAIEDISKTVGKNELFCKAVLEILKDRGEVIEKSRGTYIRV